MRLAGTETRKKIRIAKNGSGKVAQILIKNSESSRDQILDDIQSTLNLSKPLQSISGGDPDDQIFCKIIFYYDCSDSNPSF